jgi:hypothetical protein
MDSFCNGYLQHDKPNIYGPAQSRLELKPRLERKLTANLCADVCGFKTLDRSLILPHHVKKSSSSED